MTPAYLAERRALYAAVAAAADRHLHLQAPRTAVRPEPADAGDREIEQRGIELDDLPSDPDAKVLEQSPETGWFPHDA